MPIELKERQDGRVLEAVATGELTRADYAEFVPEIERLVNQHGHVGVVFDTREMTAQSAAPLWDELDFDLKALASIDRAAIVAKRDHHTWLATFAKVFKKARTHYFDEAEIVDAREWIQDENTVAAEEPEKPNTRDGSFWQVWRKQVYIALFLSATGLAGLAIEQISNANVWWYWLLILPAFAFIGIRLDQKESSRETAVNRENLWPEIRLQALHWAGFIAGLWMTFLLVKTESLRADDRGLVSLMMLAFTCYYAGIHLHRIFFLVAGALLAVFLLAAFLEQYLWVAFVLLVLAFGGMIAYQRWTSRPKNAFRKEESEPK
jgi:cation transport ATPase